MHEFNYIRQLAMHSEMTECSPLFILRMTSSHLLTVWVCPCCSKFQLLIVMICHLYKMVSCTWFCMDFFLKGDNANSYISVPLSILQMIPGRYFSKHLHNYNNKNIQSLNSFHLPLLETFSFHSQKI